MPLPQSGHDANERRPSSTTYCDTELSQDWTFGRAEAVEGRAGLASERLYNVEWRDALAGFSLLDDNPARGCCCCEAPRNLMTHNHLSDLLKGAFFCVFDAACRGAYSAKSHPTILPMDTPRG